MFSRTHGIFFDFRDSSCTPSWYLCWCDTLSSQQASDDSDTTAQPPSEKLLYTLLGFEDTAQAKPLMRACSRRKRKPESTRK
jgi:hypothetical protein